MTTTTRATRDGSDGHTTYTHESLLAMKNSEFYKLVDADIRGTQDPRGRGEPRVIVDPIAAQLLREPPTIERWYQTLIQMKKAVDGVLASKRQDFKRNQIFGERAIAHAADDGARDKAITALEDMRIDHYQSRARSMRFKTGVEEKLTEASWRRRMALGENAAAAFEERNGLANLVTELRKQRDQLQMRVDRLEQAIRAHQAETGTEDAGDADTDLWTLVNHDA